MDARNCLNCGKSFQPTQPRTSYCSDECRTVAYKRQLHEAYLRNKENRKTKSHAKQQRKKQAKLKEKHCKKEDCIYRGKFGIKTCDYMLLTGKQRNCLSYKCDKYRKR